MTFHAACLCGETRYTWDGPVTEVILCYCTQCRRANGGAFNVAVVAFENDLRFRSRGLICEYESSPGKYRSFCSGCGSPIYSRRSDLPGVYRLRGGLIDGLTVPSQIKVQHRVDGWDWLGTAG